MITTADVIYMIVTDRFADGDPTNNGAVDRTDPNRRHGGDLRGIIQKLPYLRDLGVTALWITPVYLNPEDAYHGYHPLDFEQVDPHLCSPELGPPRDPSNVSRFVEMVHEFGMKVLFDAIVCHTGLGHSWIAERPDWFNANSPDPTKWWIWGLPDLNHDRLDVNVYFADNLRRWIEATGVDAVRIDAARHVESSFWEVCKRLVRGACPGVTLIGEVWDRDPANIAPYQKHAALDSLFDYPLYHALVDVFAHDASFHRLARPRLSDTEPPGILDHDTLYRDANQLVTFLENHDTPRFFPLAGGNGGGEATLRRARLAFLFLLTTRGIPQLYYGSELSLNGGDPPNNRRDMDWDVVTDTLTTPDGAVLPLRSFIRRLISLRRESPALRYGLLVTLYVTPTLYAFARITSSDLRIVAMNNGDDAADFLLPLQVNPRLPAQTLADLSEGACLEDQQGAMVVVREGSLRIQLPARTGTIYRIVAPPEPPRENGFGGRSHVPVSSAVGDGPSSVQHEQGRVASRTCAAASGVG